MGQRVLTKVQYGLEGTHGDNVAADTMLAMKATLPEADRQIHVPNATIGTRTPLLLDSAVTRKVLAEGITLEDADGAYFEMFPLLFSSCLNGNVTPVEQTGSQSDYLWTFTAPQTGTEDVDSFTLEVGDETQAYEIGYCMVRTLRISGDVASGEVHCSADVFGDKVIQTTITAGQSLPSSVELCVAQLARVYIDDTWAGLGGSEIENALLTWDITLNGGVHPKFFGSAQREFDSHGQGEINGTAVFTFERNAAVAAEELYYRPTSTYVPTIRHVQLTFEGLQIGTGDNQKVELDMAGVWTAWQSLGGDIEGNTYDVATLTFGYDATGAQAFQALVTTTLSAI